MSLEEDLKARTLALISQQMANWVVEIQKTIGEHQENLVRSLDEIQERVARYDEKINEGDIEMAMAEVVATMPPPAPVGPGFDQLKASIEADEASIETAKTQLDYATIIAPSDGRIGVRAVDPGNIVRASDARSIALLVRTRPSAVLFTLPAHHLDDVRDALTLGPVEVTAFDQENRRKLSTGELLLIDNVIDQTTSTIRLKAIFANDDERLWPGEFVNARVQVETRRNVLAVPSSAVQRGPQGLYAWVVTANNTAVTRPIAVGPATGDMTIVTSGIAEGDRVVIDGHYKLQVNAPVTITLPQSASAK